MTVLLACLILLSLPALAQDTAPAPTGAVVQRILDSGELVCGVSGVVQGLSLALPDGSYVGFDIDLCRAVAAALLGDANAVRYQPVTSEERGMVIQDGTIDLLSRNSTVTLSRDSLWGASFGPVTFYDGQGLMVHADLGATRIDELGGATICVSTGSTTELNLIDAFNARGIDFIAVATVDDWEGYVTRRCDGYTNDVSALIGYKASAENPDDHVILDERLSKEPLAVVSSQADPQFADIVRWTMYGLIQAEEYGITSANIDEFLASDVPEIRRFLGQDDNAMGSQFGIANDFMVAVIRQVGNYGEIFDRHFGEGSVFGLGRGLNALWTDGGLMYAPPFR